MGRFPAPPATRGRSPHPEGREGPPGQDHRGTFGGRSAASQERIRTAIPGGPLQACRLWAVRGRRATPEVQDRGGVL
eukprot:2086348-Alexandrium_andersonii.AAC.1